MLVEDRECVIDPEILDLTDGFTGADMTLLMQKLYMNIRNNGQKQQQPDVNSILKVMLAEGHIKKSVSKNEIIMYNRWQSSACIY